MIVEPDNQVMQMYYALVICDNGIAISIVKDKIMISYVGKKNLQDNLLTFKVDFCFKSLQNHTFRGVICQIYLLYGAYFISTCTKTVNRSVKGKV